MVCFANTFENFTSTDWDGTRSPKSEISRQQDLIEGVPETQDSTADSLRKSAALGTIVSDAVEIKTEITKPIGEPTTQERSKNLACNNNFSSSVSGGFLSNNSFLRTDKTPSNYSAFQPDCLNPAANGECWDKPRYLYYGRFNNIKEWRGKFAPSQ